MFTLNQCLSHNAITNYVNSLKYKLRQNSRTQTKSKVSNTNYVNYVKHKLRQLLRKKCSRGTSVSHITPSQTTSTVSNTNYIKTLKHKLRQKYQTQTTSKVSNPTASKASSTNETFHAVHRSRTANRM